MSVVMAILQSMDRNLRIAGSSIMRANYRQHRAPCVVIVERAAEIMKPTIVMNNTVTVEGGGGGGGGGGGVDETARAAEER